MSFALSFDCELSFAQLLARLNEMGPWTWHERDSAWYGNIASARTSTLKLDLIESGPNETPGGSVDAGNGQQFAISVRASAAEPSPDEWRRTEAIIREVLLPNVGARNPQATDTID